MSKSYKASDIQVLEGLDAVRMRPGMYIGSTGQRGLHHMLWEIVDNAIDEAANGFADEVTVTLMADGSAAVEDNGRGIPVDIHPLLGISAVEVVYTQLHAGGKFGDENYRYSGGLHGVGASVVNALSEWLHVEVYLDGGIYRQDFASVPSPDGKILSGKPLFPLKQQGNTRKHGTRVCFLPDKRVFDEVSFHHDTVAKRLKELAFLNRGARIILQDERRLPDTQRREEFIYGGGIVDYVKYLNTDKGSLHPSPIYLEGQANGILVSAAIQYTDNYTENLFSYVNNIPTSEGGMHETGFKAGLTKVMGDYARKNGLVKDKDPQLSGDDFREGMTALLSLKMKNVQFEGQTKTKLGNPEARAAVESVITQQLQLYLDDISNLSVATKIIEKAMQAAKVRQAVRKAKDITRKMHSLEGAPLVGKLSSCTGRNPEENELIIVEGDSAGGSAKQGRDRRFQAILPLRGKPLNAEKQKLDSVLGNREFRSIITALGTGIGEDFAIDELKYHKVIILSDADQDGAHIRAILLTFFFRYMRELLASGHVYIGLSPLYRIAKGGQLAYAYSDKELAQLAKQMGRGYTVQRFKGLGEMNPEQLWETTMNPQNRTLLQVTLDDAAEADRIVTILMGSATEPRKVYISANANFNRMDAFAHINE